jgi:hypothetical protein
MHHPSSVPSVCENPLICGICFLFHHVVAVVLPWHQLALGGKMKLPCFYWKGRQAVVHTSHCYAALGHSRASMVLKPVQDASNQVMEHNVLPGVLQTKAT